MSKIKLMGKKREIVQYNIEGLCNDMIFNVLDKLILSNKIDLDVEDINNIENLFEDMAKRYDSTGQNIIKSIFEKYISTFEFDFKNIHKDDLLIFKEIFKYKKDICKQINKELKYRKDNNIEERKEDEYE